MEPKDLASLAISIISAVISVCSLMTAARSAEKQRNLQAWITEKQTNMQARLTEKQMNTQAWITNLQLLNSTAGMLIANHDLLKILGIEPDKIMKDGITPSEIVFINASLDASEAMYLVSGDKSITEYRKNFLRNDKVRTAWKKYLRNKTFSPSPWSEAVDACVADIESAENESNTAKA